MAAADTVIATFADHPAAELAIGKLAGAGAEDPQHRRPEISLQRRMIDAQFDSLLGF
jgi:hypothetical protein